MDCLSIPLIEVFHYQLLQLSFVFVDFEHIVIRHGIEKFQTTRRILTDRCSISISVHSSHDSPVSGGCVVVVVARCSSIVGFAVWWVIGAEA